MFSFDLTAPVHDDATALDGAFIPNTVKEVRAWLAGAPAAEDVIIHLPALELALAEYVKNQEAELRDLIVATLERAGRGIELDVLAPDALADWILLNLRDARLVPLRAAQANAERALERANARYDEERGFFRTDLSDPAPILYTDINARLADAFYFAWRILDDEGLRRRAGAALVQVSDAFEAGTGLFWRIELTGGARTEPDHLASYAGAIQMFLTAAETTGRGTYLARAMILADFALERFTLDMVRRTAGEQIAFANALVRLEQFLSGGKYGLAAQAILKALAPIVDTGVDAAAFALAVEQALTFPLHLVIVGDPAEDEKARAMWHAALKTGASMRAIEVLDPERQAPRIQALGYTPSAEGAVAFVCIGPLCLPPVHSVREMQHVLARAHLGFDELE
jgi:uncharacterized protein YyaL (SSP411 family)